MQASWVTSLTNIARDTIEIAGYPLSDIISRTSLPETAHLLLTGQLPSPTSLEALREVALHAATLPPPAITPQDDRSLSKMLALYLLQDDTLAAYAAPGQHANIDTTMFCLGRTATYLSLIFGNEEALAQAQVTEPFSQFLALALTGNRKLNANEKRLLEALVVAAVDHGVTPPSAQTAILAASVRAPYEIAVSQAVSTITDVHGGAGVKAAEFFLQALALARHSRLELSEAMERIIAGSIRKGARIQGLGHRIHAIDPRCEALLSMAKETGIAAGCVQCSRMASEVFSRLTGTRLPINVDGVIGAIVADMGLNLQLAQAVFILGRIAGVSAHYFEEIASFPEMRQIDFSQAVYAGPSSRPFPLGD